MGVFGQELVKALIDPDDVVKQMFSPGREALFKSKKFIINRGGPRKVHL